MSRQSKSVLCSTLTGFCVLIAACGCQAQKSPASPFHHAAEPTRDRDWPLEKEVDSEDDAFVTDTDADDDTYEEDSSSYDDSEDEMDGDDGDLEDLDLGDDDFEDDE